MPLTEYQRQLAILLSSTKTPDSYLAGGAALHIEPNSVRFSNDLDYFHDSVERVASAFSADSQLLSDHGYHVVIDMKQPGYIRTLVQKGADGTKVEWAHDSAWRFLPVVRDPICGYRLHPIDLSINKLLALVGRDEPRDFLDMLLIERSILPICALCWAAVGKDPGFSPSSLLELLKRRGKYRKEDFARLHLVAVPDITELKKKWLAALQETEFVIASLRDEETGCLFYSPSQRQFVSPQNRPADFVRHFGRPGGVLPKVCAED